MAELLLFVILFFYFLHGHAFSVVILYYSKSCLHLFFWMLIYDRRIYTAVYSLIRRNKISWDFVTTEL